MRRGSLTHCVTIFTKPELYSFNVKVKVHGFQFRYPSMKMLFRTSAGQAHYGARPQQFLPSKQLKHHNSLWRILDQVKIIIMIIPYTVMADDTK